MRYSTYTATQYRVDTFRVFTNSLCVEPDDEEERQPGIHPEFLVHAGEMEVYTSAATVHANTAEAVAGYALSSQGPYIYVESSGTCACPQTKDRAAVTAILEAARSMPKDRPLLIATSSRRAVQRLTIARGKLEANAWRGCGQDADIFRTTITTLRSRKAHTRIIYIDPVLDEDDQMVTVHDRAKQAAEERERQMADLR